MLGKLANLLGNAFSKNTKDTRPQSIVKQSAEEKKKAAVRAELSGLDGKFAKELENLSVHTDACQALLGNAPISEYNILEDAVTLGMVQYAEAKKILTQITAKIVAATKSGLFNDTEIDKLQRSYLYRDRKAERLAEARQRFYDALGVSDNVAINAPSPRQLAKIVESTHNILLG